jgi:hypothetical protein
MDEFHPEIRDPRLPTAISLATNATILADNRRRGLVDVRFTGADYDSRAVRQLC